jgi:hypothetical protein
MPFHMGFTFCETYLVLFKTDPGDITGTMGDPAHAAMAVRTPFAGQVCGKLDRAAKTTAIRLFVRFHFLVLRIEK